VLSQRRSKLAKLFLPSPLRYPENVRLISSMGYPSMYHSVLSQRHSKLAKLFLPSPLRYPENVRLISSMGYPSMYHSVLSQRRSKLAKLFLPSPLRYPENVRLISSTGARYLLQVSYFFPQSQQQGLLANHNMFFLPHTDSRFPLQKAGLPMVSLSS
jgi:hypothetical protein